MTTENPYQPPPFKDEDQTANTSTPSAVLTTRKVLWVHVAAVSCVTVFLFRAGGDLHAVQPPALYVVVIPAVYSLFLLPPLIAYTLLRDRNVWSLSLAAELILALVHFIIVATGFSSY
jgi:hypothetical protein